MPNPVQKRQAILKDSYSVGFHLLESPKYAQRVDFYTCALFVRLDTHFWGGDAPGMFSARIVQLVVLHRYLMRRVVGTIKRRRVVLGRENRFPDMREDMGRANRRPVVFPLRFRSSSRPDARAAPHFVTFHQ